MKKDSESGPHALQRVLHYHDITKHHFQGYARGPGYLDWATQPDPFRRYSGASLVPLERMPPTDKPLYDDAFVPGRLPPTAVTRRTISQFFYDSLAISAWKSTGEVQWALRVNPSSGNLHPTEGYLICGPIADLFDTPTVCHYAPKEHGLEVRAEVGIALWGQLSAGLPAETFLVGLTSIHWRETWKYGQRGYRYCQHDAGHAIGAISIAAAGLGWQTRTEEGRAATVFGFPANGSADTWQPTFFQPLVPHHRTATPNGIKRSVYGSHGDRRPRLRLSRTRTSRPSGLCREVLRGRPRRPSGHCGFQAVWGTRSTCSSVPYAFARASNRRRSSR